MFINQKLEKLTSHNFVGLLEGTDPALKDEIIVFTAHWDHLGRKGSDIFHGARDNALGVGALLEIARALKSLPPHKRRRSALFLFTTWYEKPFTFLHNAPRHTTSFI
jgi:Zn-dependent M28 family amino/carboxypeptidase